MKNPALGGVRLSGAGMNYHSHYETLSVARDAPAEVIRAAYKALSQRHHPDKNPGDAEAAEKMQALNNAYETLSDPEKRAAYDIELAQVEAMINEWMNPRVHHPPTQEPPVQPTQPGRLKRGRAFDINWAVVAEVQGRQKRKYSLLSRNSLFAIFKTLGAIYVSLFLLSLLNY